jgi:lysozyme family protein
MSAVDVLIARVLDREGGIKDLGDGKGVTRFGQTPGWLAQFGFTAPTTPVEAAANYAAWLNATHLIRIVGPVVDDLADIVIDIAVMSSAPKGIMALQATLHIPVDGVFGAQTLAALATTDRKQLARDVIAWDMVFQGRLIVHDPIKLARWAAGWAKRLADHVRQLA